MQIGVIGLNFESASLESRELFLKALKTLSLDQSHVLLSTCNRVELYLSHVNIEELENAVVSHIKNFMQSECVPIYSLSEEECFLHLVSVTAGMKSSLLGEHSIQRQVKMAYETARCERKLSSSLHYLFQKSLKIAKTLRSLAPPIHPLVTLESTIFQLVEELSSYSLSLLLLGYSETNRKIIHYFSRRCQHKMTLLSHRKELPSSLALNTFLKSYNELQNAHHYDVIISATTASRYLLSSLNAPCSTQLIIDLCMPRTIHPQIKSDLGISLLTMDHLSKLLEDRHHLQLADLEEINSLMKKMTDLYAQKLEERRLKNASFILN
ncbi:MAG: hypothetical protein QRY71_06360 [Candidatus Rhabdochlamydia sp.]